MQHLRIDILRLHHERDELFIQRWALGAEEYRRRLSDLNTRIWGYELLLCEQFRRSLPSIFPPTETNGS